MAGLICSLFAVYTLLIPLQGEQEEKIYTVSEVNVKPEPPKGIADFQKRWSAKVTYPPSAVKENIQGLVYVEFVVGTDGTISDANVKVGLGYGCDEAALEAFVALTKEPWSPGIRKEEPVKVKMVLPFYFRIVKM